MEKLGFLKQVTGFRYYLNRQKPFRKSRMGQIHQGIRKCIQNNREQEIFIAKYSMLSEKTIQMLSNKLKIFEKIRDSGNIPKSIMKYYCHFFTNEQSSLYIISQYFKQAIPLQLKVVHPTQLMTVVSKQILQAFVYLQSIEVYTTFFTIYINDRLQIKLGDFGFQYQINSFNYQYQTDCNLCVDWVWGYIPGQKFPEIYEQYEKQNLTQLVDQKLKEQKSQKLYTWLYGLIIYNKLCSTMLTDQKYKIRESTGEYWYPWCCLLKCLFIRDDKVDYSKKYKMISMDVLAILKKFQNSYSGQDIVQSYIMQQVEPAQQSQRFISKYFQFFTDIEQLQLNSQYTEVQVKSSWMKALVQVLKKYVFQPYRFRATVANVMQIIHGPSEQNDLLNKEIIQVYVGSQFQYVKMLNVSQEIYQREHIRYQFQSQQDPQFQKWYKRFLYQSMPKPKPEPEAQKKKQLVKKQPKPQRQSKQQFQKLRTRLFAFTRTLFYCKKQLKQKNTTLLHRLSYIEMCQSMFKALCSRKKRNQPFSPKLQSILQECEYQQIQKLRPIAKQLILIHIYTQIIQILQNIRYNRQEYQQQRNRIFTIYPLQEQEQTQAQIKKNIDLYNYLGYVLNKQQEQYNAQVCLYVQICHKLRIRLQEIYKILCQYNYVMVMYISELQQPNHNQQHQQRLIIAHPYAQFIKNATNLIVITKIHEILLASKLKNKNQQDYVKQYLQFIRQFNTITTDMSEYLYKVFQQVKKVVDQTKLSKQQSYTIYQYYFQLMILMMIGYITPMRTCLQLKNINTHTSTFMHSFIKQHTRKLYKQPREQLKQHIIKDRDKIKKVTQLIHIHVPIGMQYQ